PVAHGLRHRLGDLRIAGEGGNRARIGVHPVDGLAIGRDERAVSLAPALRSVALAMITRTVWLRTLARSFAVAMMRMRPSLAASKPNGGVEKPTSIWPDITWVKVAGTLPVAASLGSIRYSLRNRSAVMCVPDPLVE